MSSSQPGRQLHVCIGSRQEYPGCLDETIASDDEGPIELRQLDQSVMEARAREHPGGPPLSLEWIGNKLPGAFKYLQGIAEHEDGADSLSMLGRLPDLAGYGDSALQDLWPNPVREFHQVRNCSTSATLGISVRER